MKYIFVLGRNRKLSEFEIISVLENRNIAFSIADEGRDFIAIESENIEGLADKLGGTIKNSKNSG